MISRQFVFLLCATLPVCAGAAGQDKPADTNSTAKLAPETVKVYIPGKDVTAPELLPADYSHALTDKCDLNVTGEVEFSLIVDADGVPRDVTFLRPIGNDLDLLAMKLVRADRFKPAQFNGSPVAVGEAITIKLDTCVVTETDAFGKTARSIRLHSAPNQVLSKWKNAPTEFPQKTGSGVAAPVPIYTVSPDFSEEARKAMYQGEVVVQVIVDANGIPQNPRVVRPLGMGLDEKAIEAVRHYRFKPAMNNGKPVPVIMTIAINFRMQEKPR